MYYEFTNPALESFFGLTDDLQADLASFSNLEGANRIIWNRNEVAVRLKIDGMEMDLAPQQLLTTTFYHQVEFLPQTPALTGIFFNQAFYCLFDHDEEVSCNGILFFGTQDIPILTLTPPYNRKLDLLMDVMMDEAQTRDNIQGEMLLMLLKRFIILSTRLAKEQMQLQQSDDQQLETLRKFSFLVDKHFREKKKVKEYADMLFKSPKTLSNLFHQHHQHSPQQIIQERVVLEAKRLLQFTDLQNQEIAYQLGFEDPAYFSRYFRKIAGLSPSAYREGFVGVIR
ncbi:MAG: helix-turn-helix domain-containing protein [Bacteroidota bacterium]